MLAEHIVWNNKININLLIIEVLIYRMTPIQSASALQMGMLFNSYTTTI